MLLKQLVALLTYVQHGGAWRERAAACEITEHNAKHISVGFPCGGSVLPDQDWKPRQDRATGVLSSTSPAS